MCVFKCLLRFYSNVRHVVFRIVPLTNNVKASSLVAKQAYISILQAGKDSSCMTTVLLLARTIMFSSCCLSWVSWYHSLMTSVSWVGIRVTWRQKGGTFELQHYDNNIEYGGYYMSNSPVNCFPTGSFLPAEHQGRPCWAPVLPGRCRWLHSKRNARGWKTLHRHSSHWSGLGCKPDPCTWGDSWVKVLQLMPFLSQHLK